MAIDEGLQVVCTDLQASGGVRNILLRSWTAGDAVTYVNSAAAHSISSIKKSGPANADWFIYEFTNETAALTVNATKENGSTVFECGLSFTIPNMTAGRFHELQNLLSECMMGIVVDSNGTPFVIGASEKYENESVQERSQTYLNVASMEGVTGAAYNDDNGVTVSLMAKQYELPRVYTGTLTLYTGALGTQEATTD